MRLACRVVHMKPSHRADTVSLLVVCAVWGPLVLVTLSLCHSHNQLVAMLSIAVFALHHTNDTTSIASTNTTASWKSNNFYKIASLNQKHPTCFAILILMQSGDLNPNPGPYQPKFPCAICKKAARWDERATCCDHCNSWYHVDCMGMSTIAYNALQNSQVSWICCQCGIPNFASSLFSNSTIELTNSFSVLSDISTSDCCEPLSPPLATSSPYKQRDNTKNNNLNNR